MRAIHRQNLEYIDEIKKKIKLLIYKKCIEVHPK